MTASRPACTTARAGSSGRPARPTGDTSTRRPRLPRGFRRSSRVKGSCRRRRH
jgi:hypothetical protein